MDCQGESSGESQSRKRSTTYNNERRKLKRPKHEGDPPLYLPFVTWNIVSKDVEDEVSDRDATGYSQIRSFFIRKFFTSPWLDHIPFACLQEVGNLTPLASCEELPVTCKVAPTCCAAVAGPDTMDGYKVEYTSLPPITPSSKYKIDGSLEYFEGRYHGEIVQLKDGDDEVVCEFILVSYHASNQGSDGSKRQKLTNFFEIMCDVADEHKKTIIVGGSFNLAIDKWKVKRSLGRRIKVAGKYRNDRRSEDSVVDTFVAVHQSEEGGFVHCTLITSPIGVQFIETNNNENEHFCPCCYFDCDGKEIDDLIGKIKSENPEAKIHWDHGSVMSIMDHDPVHIREIALKRNSN